MTGIQMDDHRTTGLPWRPHSGRGYGAAGQLRLGRNEALDRVSQLHPQQAKAWLRSELSEGSGFDPERGPGSRRFQRRAGSARRRAGRIPGRGLRLRCSLREEVQRLLDEQGRSELESPVAGMLKQAPHPGWPRAACWAVTESRPSWARAGWSSLQGPRLPPEALRRPEGAAAERSPIRSGSTASCRRPGRPPR